MPAGQPFLEQGEPLLRTKLFVPSLRLKRVARPGLIRQLNDSLDQALVLVSAPAGFGKTTLLAEWAGQAGLPVAWLSLDAADNDPHRFLCYVVAALQGALGGQEAACQAAQAMLQSAQPVPIQAILVALINDLATVPQPFALVLDDAQFITAPPVNESLAFLLERMPPQMRLVIATRVDPALPLHRLRAAQRLREIRTADLRFSGSETEAFLNRVMELGLAQADVSTLLDRTEGWVVGLQMAALSMQGLSDRPAFVRALSGSHRYILEYLIEEVLARQPEYIQSFLLQTSILDRLCGPLCEALIENRDSRFESSQLSPGLHESPRSILEYLYRANLFLVPLDSEQAWFRYHHLFADLLRARLERSQPESLPLLHLRASRWYEEANLPEEAIRHALAARATERAAWLVERYAFDIMSRGEMSSLLRLFESLPEGLILSRPGLGLYQAWAFTFTGQIGKVEPQLQQVEQQIPPGATSPDAKAILGTIAVIRGLLADLRGELAAAVELARRADELLPEGKWAERSIISFVLGDGYFAAGELGKAEQAFEQIFQAGRVAGNPWTVSVALHKLALVKKLQGKLHSVEALYREAIRFAGEKGGRQYGSLGATYVGLSDLLREWDELLSARQMVLQAIDNMQRWQSPTDLVNGYLTLARICLAQGEIENAEDAFARAEEIGRQGGIFPITARSLEDCQVRLWLARADISRAGSWLAGMRSNEGEGPEQELAEGRPLDFVRELGSITAARVYIARDELDRAVQLLARLAEDAGRAGRNGRLVEILALQGLALSRMGRREQGIETLCLSLTLSGPEGYRRIYLDEGRPMQELLQACSRKLAGAQKAYADRLLAAFPAPPGLAPPVLAPPADRQPEASPSPPQPAGLFEPLTARETEVLRLLAAGLSNQEIAGRLTLSEGTIKTHTHNLYGKLGVQSRTQAIARAKELTLL